MTSETREKLRMIARQRTLKIEERYADRHVPPNISAIYRLYRAIVLADLNEYVAEIGPSPISASDARDGKAELGWSDQLSAFESDCVRAVNKFIACGHRPPLARIHPFSREV